MRCRLSTFSAIDRRSIGMRDRFIETLARCGFFEFMMHMLASGCKRKRWRMGLRRATGRNLVFHELRRRSRHTQLPLQVQSEEEELPIRDEHAWAPDALFLEQELQRAIETAIAQLPETQRMAVVLRRYNELSYEQIADVLGQSVPAVKSLLFRARTELRTRLGRYLTN